MNVSAKIIAGGVCGAWLKRFIRAVFWWDNPKGGAFFGLLVLTLLIPATILLAVNYPAKEETFRRCFELAGCLAAGYALILSALYAVRLFRLTFGGSAVRAVAVGLPLFPVMLPVCAAKRRDWPAFALTLAGVATCVAVCVMRDRVLLQLPVFELAVLAALAMLLAAMRRVDCGMDTGRLLAFSPLLAGVAVTAALIAHCWHLERRVEAETTRTLGLTGIGGTYDDMVAAFTNGVPITAEPYAALYSEKTKFPEFNHAWRTKGDGSPPWMIPDDTRAEFGAYCISNATLVALLDEMTARRDYRPAYPPEDPHDSQSFSLVLSFYRMVEFYATRIVFAQGVDAMPRIVEDMRRADNILSWLDACPTFTLETIAAVGNGMLNTALGYVLPRLPDEVLADRQAGCRRLLAASDARTRLMMRNEILTLHARFHPENLKSLVDATSRWYPMSDWRRYMLGGLARYYRIGMCHILLANLHATDVYLECLSAPAPEGKTRLEVLQERDTVEDASGIFGWVYLCPDDMYLRLLQREERATLLSTAIAVERYRRKYAALPEALDALVPEFLDAVPVSVYDGKPLAYEHGLVEVAPHPDTPKLFKDWTPYTYTGFRVSGSFYVPASGKAKWKQDSLRVPIPDGEGGGGRELGVGN